MHIAAMAIIPRKNEAIEQRRRWKRRERYIFAFFPTAGCLPWHDPLTRFKVGRGYHDLASGSHRMTTSPQRVEFRTSLSASYRSPMRVPSDLDWILRTAKYPYDLHCEVSVTLVSASSRFLSSTQWHTLSSCNVVCICFDVLELQL